MKKKDGKLIINTSTTSNRLSKLKSPEVVSNIKYNELYEKFVKLFKAKGYVQSDSFDSKVWFLREDVFFISIISKSSLTNTSMTPTPSGDRNRIHEILSEINDNSDFANLLVSVETFIYKVVESLLIAVGTVERSNRTIESFQATKRNQIIKESIRLLESKSEKYLNTSKFQSKMKAKIIKAINFQPGKYEFTMKFFEIISNNMSQTNLALNNEDSRIAIDNKAELIESRFSPNEFETIIFSALDLVESSNMKFKSSNNSGSSFSNFSVASYEMESKKVFLLDTMLNSIDNLLDISKTQFKEVLELNLSQSITKPNLKNQGLAEDSSRSILLECTFEFDPLTRSSILKRISSVFSDVIETKRTSDAVIDQILDTYFEEISESVRHILNKQPEQSKDACCDCIVF